MLKNTLKKYLLDSVLKDRKLFLWGAGIRGVKLLNKLNELELQVMGFGDNNINKVGKLYYNLMCYSRAELLEIQKDNEICIMVSPRVDGLSKDLASVFHNVLPDTLVELILDLPSNEEYGIRTSGYNDFLPIGHYYSLYPDLNKILSGNSGYLWGGGGTPLDINMNEKEQEQLIKKMLLLWETLPQWFQDEKSSKLRYNWPNEMFPPLDAVVLYAILRLFQPKKIIEVGSGFSSAVMLDTNELYMDNKIQLVFLEPYADRLKSLLKEKDKIELIETGLQEVAVNEFEKLEKGDLLFIDSTHVSKAGSDVNYLFFEILPRLKSGVIIHFHDIFYPFEYPLEWLRRGVVWNEAYLLRAFLENNDEYEVIYFQSLLLTEFRPLFETVNSIKDYVENGGGSIYIRKR